VLLRDFTTKFKKSLKGLSRARARAILKNEKVRLEPEFDPPLGKTASKLRTTVKASIMSLLQPFLELHHIS
jgi:hypothetical protein